MGWLVPDITKPVTLKLTADDAKREAAGRILSLAGAGVGILGGIMILRANPALQGAVAAKQGMSITLSAEAARQDAFGKALALIGTAVGTAGSVMVMSASPKMKAKFASTFDQLPAGVKENKRALAFAAVGLLAAGTYYLIKSQNQALMTERYAS